MTYSSFLMDCVDEWADEHYTQWDEEYNDLIAIRHDEMIDSISLEEVFGGDK